MVINDLRKLFRYNRWATTAMLEALDGLSHEELVQDRGSSFPSLWATLEHLFGAERIWLDRWKNNSPEGFPDRSATESVRTLRRRWEALWEEQDEYLNTLSDADVQGPKAYRGFNGDPNVQRLGELMYTVINHATYHRGQLATMLRQAGRVPPSTDYVRYLREVEP